MPPAPRSMPSAPSTPRASTKTNTDSESPARTPRKSPHCKTCGRPRKGHPLRACDSADPSLKNTTPAPENPTSNLIDALATLKLAERDRNDKRERRQSSAQPGPLQSLPSISTVTGELLESLKAPGLLDDDGSEFGDDPEKRDIVIRWREVSGMPECKDAGQRIHSPIPPHPSSPSTGNSQTFSDEATPTKKQHAGK
ncbi:hypothetical protein FB451DRAFT_1267566 [Mycena latifolia]|nr:hypothetical protein FB451DRAFT_1267566 [Mycena latifolia]